MSVGRDYKSRKQRPDRRGVRRLGLVVVALSLVGLGTGGWHYWQQGGREAATVADTVSAPVQPREQASAQGALSPAQVEPPKYSFYEKLRQREVLIPDDADAPPSALRTAPPRPAAAGASARYLVQAGAFRTSKEADQRKAMLAVLGIRSQIEADDNGLHRVRIGPLEDLDRVQALRRQLEANDIDSYAFKAD